MHRQLPPDVAAAIADLSVAARETATASRELVARIDRFRRGDPPNAPPSRTDLKRAVGAALQIVDREIRARAHLALALEEVRPVAADATQVSQVVINLVMNALEALAEGHERQLSVRLSGEEERAVLEVADNGPGIAPELLPRIFEPFVSTRTQEVARGFGLAIVHEIVQQLGGEIRVASQLGQGATFTVRLPYAS
jgi:C4-dicarboxylate-specific signal transduction histidine kinase